ncbi:MAG: response regulator [Gallionellaceae bacterium]|jgi:DNA-binding NtrC family response regulator
MSKVLLVDDEQNVLNALRRELREYFEIETFDNPLMALEHCRHEQFDLVVADYKMPEMNGIEFLKKFGELQPDASRIVLSGEADIDALIRTINETHIYRFLAKPWEKAELLSSIQQALAYRAAILNSRSSANASPGTRAAVSREQTPYRIVLAESDMHLQAIMSRGLTEESGQSTLYGAMQQELHHSAESEKFACVVEVFRTGRDVLQHMESNRCDLIIAAQTLQDMDGIQLLRQMRQIIPDAARILISNDPNKTLLSQAINEAEVQNVLQLHWSNYELRADVRRQAWNIYQLKTASIQALAARDIQIQGAKN